MYCNPLRTRWMSKCFFFLFKHLYMETLLNMDFTCLCSLNGVIYHLVRFGLNITTRNHDCFFLSSMKNKRFKIVFNWVWVVLIYFDILPLYCVKYNDDVLCIIFCVFYLKIYVIFFVLFVVYCLLNGMINFILNQVLRYFLSYK